MNYSRDADSVLTDSERQVLRQVCDEIDVPASIVEKMILAEHRVYGMGRRHGLWEELELLIEEGVKRDGSNGEREDFNED